MVYEWGNCLWDAVFIGEKVAKKWWAWRLLDICSSPQIIAVIIFVRNQSCPLTSPTDDTLICFYPIAYQRILISCWHIRRLQKHKTQYTFKRSYRDFPGGPVAKTLSSQYRGPVFWSMGQGIRSHMPQLKIPHAATKTEDPECCNRANE